MDAEEIKNCMDLAAFLELPKVDFKRTNNFMQLMDIVRSWNGGLDFSFENNPEIETVSLPDLFVRFEVVSCLKKDHGGVNEHIRFKKILQLFKWEKDPHLVYV